MNTLETATDGARTSGYVSSTGVIGSYADPVNDRYRGLVGSYIDDAAVLSQAWNNFCNEAEHQPAHASRRTMRAPVAADVARTLRGHLPIEAAIELDEESVLLYLAHNDENRQSPQPVATIRAAVDADGEAIRSRFRSPRSRVEALLANSGDSPDEQYRFVRVVPDVEQLVELWGPTFNWDETGIRDLQEQLAENATRQPADRDTWFTGIMHGDQLVAAMMAQRLDVPGRYGDHITVESTEWRTRDDYSRHGVGAAMVAMNTAQVCNDMPSSATIFGECNTDWDIRADRAGQSVGYIVPPNDLAAHVLVENVYVDGRLRNFAVLQLSGATAREHYSPGERRAMLAHLG